MIFVVDFLPAHCLHQFFNFFVFSMWSPPLSFPANHVRAHHVTLSCGLHVVLMMSSTLVNRRCKTLCSESWNKSGTTAWHIGPPHFFLSQFPKRTHLRDFTLVLNARQNSSTFGAFRWQFDTKTAFNLMSCFKKSGYSKITLTTAEFAPLNFFTR